MKPIYIVLSMFTALSARAEWSVSNPEVVPTENIVISQLTTGGNALQSRHVSESDWKGLSQSFRWQSETALRGIGICMSDAQPEWKHDQQYILIIQALSGYRGVPEKEVYHLEFSITAGQVGANRWLYLDLGAVNLKNKGWYGFILCPAEKDISKSNRIFWATSTDDKAYAEGSVNQLDLITRGLPPSGPYGGAKRDLTFYLQATTTH